MNACKFLLYKSLLNRWILSILIVFPFAFNAGSVLVTVSTEFCFVILLVSPQFSHAFDGIVMHCIGRECVKFVFLVP